MPARRRATEPVQERARATREDLIAAAATLLGEVGVERLSTNLICARANVTPPAFYRYFKDKYAILEELGLRLMAAQNHVITEALREDVDAITAPQLCEIILASIAVTRDFPGGPWILRALRAVPALQHVRIDSHRRMSALVAAALSRDAASGAEARLRARLMIDMGYAAIELAFDEPRVKRQALAQAAAEALVELARAPGKARSKQSRMLRS